MGAVKTIRKRKYICHKQQRANRLRKLFRWRRQMGIKPVKLWQLEELRFKQLRESGREKEYDGWLF